MTVTVSDMARINSYVAAGQPLERYLKVNKFSPEDEAEVRTIWADTEQAFANLKPGEQLMSPSEWS